MIIIQSDSNDASTHTIIRWLAFYNEDFLRFDDQTEIKIKAIDSNGTIILCFNNYEINFNDIKSYWYRRGYFTVNIGKTAVQGLNSFVLKEEKDALEFVHEKLLKINHIGNFKTDDVNKLLVSEYAVECGLKIPDYLITSHKSELKKFFNHNKIITKHIQGLPYFRIDDFSIGSLTQIVADKDIIGCPDVFGVSLFQKYIEKRFEIRVFFIKDKFYSAAIFSQNNERTNVDFRNYDREKPNRVVPYTLPIETENKLKKLNEKIRINSGSYDLIYSKEGEYYFLEVNPIGQFGQISNPCNYYIEKIIAEILMRKNDE